MLAFALYTKSDYQVNWHHKLMCQKLDAFIRGEIQYLMVFMPPRHGKSELISRKLPAFLHGVHPEIEIMAVSYLDSLAGEMCTAVQDVIESSEYHILFPNTRILPPRSVYTDGVRNSSEHTIVDPSGRKMGRYMGQGVGGSFTGKGANVILIDDPIKGREIADSPVFREKLWNFWLNDLYSRLETSLKNGKRGQALITQCMTGDTRVLMADGTETKLRDIKVGDCIATYENGQISVSKIQNWKCQGPDSVFAIRMRSGITVKANDRHPFLVCRNGGLQWVRLRDLRVNEKLIRVGERGKENCAHAVDAESLQSAKACACHITIKRDGPQDIDHHQLIQRHEGLLISDKDTELIYSNTIESSKNREKFATYAKNHHLKSTLQHIGTKNSASTTNTKQEKSEDYSVTNVISLLNTGTQYKSCSPLLNTYDLTLDYIDEIKAGGHEDVFDIQVDRTENFIANGLVTHNTRWHEDDLSGRMIEAMKKNPKAMQWEIISFPAIRTDRNDQIDPRQIGEALWPQKYNLEKLNEIKETLQADGGGVRAWTSLYQQNPVPDGGLLFKDEMFEFCELPKQFHWKFTTADTSYKEKEENDFTVFSVWGVIHDSLFLIDVFRKQMKASDVEAQVEPFLKKQLGYGYRHTLIEPKGHGIYLNQKWAKSGLMIPDAEDLKKFFSDRRLSKDERAKNVVGYLSSRKVYINKTISIKEELVSECLAFPKGKHDDFVDTLCDALKKVYTRERSLFDVL